MASQQTSETAGGLCEPPLTASIDKINKQQEPVENRREKSTIKQPIVYTNADENNNQAPIGQPSITGLELSMGIQMKTPFMHIHASHQYGGMP